MLSAQVITGPSQLKFGMNRPGIDNRQLTLNIMHWLSGFVEVIYDKHRSQTSLGERKERVQRFG
jgi:hypothetical protein